MNILQYSGIGSLLFQFLTGVFEAQALAFTIPPEDEIVKEILTMELIVQLIEFIFYVYLVYLIFTNDVSKSVTSHRYIDWAITTPVMLISFIMFFKYLREPERKIRLFDSIQEESSNIIKVVLANACMLLFGFLAEQSIIDRSFGIAIGFIPFAYVFKILYAEYAKYTPLATNIFYFSFSIWSLYGVGATLPFIAKNTMYNILDFFAKNVYGLFLYFFLYSKRIQQDPKTLSEFPTLE